MRPSTDRADQRGVPIGGTTLTQEPKDQKPSENQLMRIAFGLPAGDPDPPAKPPALPDPGKGSEHAMDKLMAAAVRGQLRGEPSRTSNEED
jgi:hypothetical protein